MSTYSKYNLSNSNSICFTISSLDISYPSLYREVAISDISFGNSLLFTLIPIPITIKLTLSSAIANSERIPPIFLEFKIISLGHFIKAHTPKSFSTLTILAPAI